MKKMVIGILAHVDSGKTTLSESMLYVSGKVRRLGRVDHGDAFLDTYELEKSRGIINFISHDSGKAHLTIIVFRIYLFFRGNIVTSRQIKTNNP